MRRYNKVSWIFLILTVITFALAAPVLVQDKRQAWVDVVHVPEDVVTILGKRIMDEDLNVVWHPVHVHFLNVLGEHPAAPPLNVPPPNPAEVQVPEVHAPPPNPAEVQVAPEVHAPPLPMNPADSESDSESIDLDDDAPPASPEWSTESEDLWRRRARARRQSARTRTVGQRSRMCRARSLGERSWDGVAEFSSVELNIER
jgi:hypothetical protein